MHHTVSQPLIQTKHKILFFILFFVTKSPKSGEVDRQFFQVLKSEEDDRQFLLSYFRREDLPLIPLVSNIEQYLFLNFLQYWGKVEILYALFVCLFVSPFNLDCIYSSDLDIYSNVVDRQLAWYAGGVYRVITRPCKLVQNSECPVKVKRKSWESPEKVLRKFWESPEKVMGKSLNKFLRKS